MSSFLKSTFVLLVLGLAIFLSGHALANQDVVELSKVTKVYAGNEGLRVTIVQVMPLTREEALVKISGVDNPDNDKVFLCKIEKQVHSSGKLIDIKYVITRNGKPWNLVIGHGLDYMSYKVNLVGAASQEISYSEKDSSAGSPTILADYQKQKN